MLDGRNDVWFIVCAGLFFDKGAFWFNTTVPVEVELLADDSAESVVKSVSSVSFARCQNWNFEIVPIEELWIFVYKCFLTVNSANLANRLLI
jgi:hypothetical protein